MAKVKNLLDSIEWICNLQGVKSPDRMQLRAMLRDELREIAAKEDWDWAKSRLDPAIQTAAGVRNYTLPASFGDNFARASDSEDKPCCKLNDGTTETALNYLGPAQFFGQNLQAQQNSKPVDYTVITVPTTGRRELWLSPPPDDEYTIGGVFTPNDWDVGDESAIPPIPADANVLKYAVLRRLSPQFAGDYVAAFADLARRSVETRKTMMAPRVSRYY
jgi:hypothetical protein